MNIDKMIRFLVLILFLTACNANDTFLPEPKLVAESQLVMIEQIADKEYSKTDIEIGRAFFYEANNVITIEITLENMEPNTSKAVHIHQGTVELPGRHWNQGSFNSFCNERSLGELWAKPFAGDVGNVDIDENGHGQFILSTDLWAINSNDNKDILNRAIIIHQNAEDFLTECDQNHTHDMPHMNQKIAGGMIISLVLEE